MKSIYVDRKPISGPWGGGNKTVQALCQKLSETYKVVFDLNNSVDLIFCFDPRPNKQGLWYQHYLNYKTLNPGVKIIQRVGDLGTHSKPELTNLVVQSIEHSDHVIFPSLWAKNYINFKKENFSIIHNAALESFFNKEKPKRTTNEKVKIVTHHWSNNPKKGFDVYSSLGMMIQEKYSDKIDFTYIGRYNDNYSSKGINLIEPINSKELSKKLLEYDVYLTASLEEAGANHVLEAMAAGLPILYRVGGGSINEYCYGMGEEYSDLNHSNIEEYIEKLTNKKYNTYKNSMKLAMHSYERVVNEVLNQR